MQTKAKVKMIRKGLILTSQNNYSCPPSAGEGVGIVESFHQQVLLQLLPYDPLHYTPSLSMDDPHLPQLQPLGILDEIIKHLRDLLGEVSVEIEGIGDDYQLRKFLTFFWRGRRREKLSPPESKEGVQFRPDSHIETAHHGSSPSEHCQLAISNDQLAS